jgi:hypothetical protein
MHDTPDWQRQVGVEGVQRESVEIRLRQLDVVVSYPALKSIKLFYYY